MKLFDLSYPMLSGMPVYPGDDAVTVRQNRFLATHHYNNFVTAYGQHVGTHVDGPMHMTDTRTHIGEIPPEQFCGPAVVYDVRGLTTVTPADVLLSRLSAGRVVLFHTGWAEKYGTAAYYEGHPVLSVALAEQLIAADVKLVGVDMPSPDHVPFPVHKRLLAAGVLIVENLRGLDQLLDQPDVRFYAFPLPLQADSSPVRAIAEVRD